MARLIGIRHRRKKTKEGEARPTLVVIKSNGKAVEHELDTETDELDFLMARFPIAHRAVGEDEDISSFLPHHLKWKKAEKEEVIRRPTGHVRTIKGARGPVTQVVTKVPSKFDGLQDGDTVGMVLGGSGDRLAAALSRRGEEVNAKVFRCPQFVVKDYREDTDTVNDHYVLIRLLADKPEVFYFMTPRDRDAIRINEAFRMRMEAQKDRIACELRLYSSLVGKIFLNTEGRYPEGVIEDAYDAERANDKVLQALDAEESRRDSQLSSIVRSTPIWDAIFEEIEGCGPRIAAGLIGPITDIRRFWRVPDPKVMAELYERSQRLETQGRLKEDQHMVADRIRPNTTPFQILQMLRSYKLKHAMQADARFLEEAVAIHQERAQLRRKAHFAGMSALKKFCGVHVNTHDEKGNPVPKERQFPRRRRGERCNWNPTCRQALYLLADQWFRRPGSFWGSELRKSMEHFRQVHPETIEVEVETEGRKKKVKRYNDLHIRRMASWRTASRFVEELFRTWTKLEKNQLGLADEAESAVA